jgi:hypothetical protein
MSSKWIAILLIIAPASLCAQPPAGGESLPAQAIVTLTPRTMSDLAAKPSQPVVITEVSDYVFGGYAGAFPSPPHADLNPKRAFVIQWRDRPGRCVFAHEASYCPFFELPSGAGLCYQFFEGNDGFAELFNDRGRREENSFIDVLEAGPQRVRVRWTYFGVNMESGQRAYRGMEEFTAFPNGLILRRQSYESLMPDDHRGYAREPIEMIGLCPVGKLWRDVLRRADKSEERHSICMMDAFSDKRYDGYWTPKAGTVFDSTRRRAGAPWKALDDAAGVALVLPLADGLPFCVFGDASGFGHSFTRLKDHSFPDTGGMDWGSTSWDHWPIGWLNSQAHPVDSESLKKYPNHFSPMGMDFFALSDRESARGIYYSLLGVGEDFEPIRTVARQWLDLGADKVADSDAIARLRLPSP